MSDERFLGCILPANRLCSCCPLQLAGYATSLLALICAIFNALRIMTQTFAGPPAYLQLAIRCPLIVGQLILTHVAWQGSSLLDANCVKRAVQLLNAWIWIKLAFTGLLIVALLTAFIRLPAVRRPHHIHTITWHHTAQSQST
eukprot:Blabericola_migrator_1__8848@NODE_467_length_8246_cov_85_807189_g364_i1_p7_GENE_NODE_467_length_8246_cov_85_807189_g364_i1NODE_467_length_8246_cov_85_807189_g364_i1_p7_ORF_typecomplete_len143_score4_85_NODE_467_length_8246_cov_85_807189_g364_i167987226